MISRSRKRKGRKKRTLSPPLPLSPRLRPPTAPAPLASLHPPFNNHLGKPSSSGRIHLLLLRLLSLFTALRLELGRVPGVDLDERTGAGRCGFRKNWRELAKGRVVEWRAKRDEEAGAAWEEPSRCLRYRRSYKRVLCEREDGKGSGNQQDAMRVWRGEASGGLVRAEVDRAI